MGAALGSDDPKSRNVELNIIPFIDLLSCLTAFLLVTAVWVNVSQLDVEVAGAARDVVIPPGEDPELSVLVEASGIWVGVSRVNEHEHIPRTEAGHDWARLEASLRGHKGSALFVARSRVEVAAGSTASEPVAYETLIAAMDVAVKAGFGDVKFTDPRGLSAQPQR